MGDRSTVISDSHLQAVLDIWSQRSECITCSVSGDCMAPSVREGNVITVRGGSQDVRVGDVIVFGTPGRLFVKRVLKIDKRGGEAFFLTKGDRNTEFFGQIPGDRVLGKVLKVRGPEGDFNFTSCFWKVFNRLLAIRSYFHGNRRHSNSLVWRWVNVVYCRSGVLRGKFTGGSLVWRGICRAQRISSAPQEKNTQ